MHKHFCFEIIQTGGESCSNVTSRPLRSRTASRTLSMVRNTCMRACMRLVCSRVTRVLTSLTCSSMSFSSSRRLWDLDITRDTLRGTLLPSIPGGASIIRSRFHWGICRPRRSFSDSGSSPNTSSVGDSLPVLRSGGGSLWRDRRGGEELRRSSLNDSDVTASVTMTSFPSSSSGTSSRWCLRLEPVSPPKDFARPLDTCWANDTRPGFFVLSGCTRGCVLFVSLVEIESTSSSDFTGISACSYWLTDIRLDARLSAWLAARSSVIVNTGFTLLHERRFVCPDGTGQTVVDPERSGFTLHPALPEYFTLVCEPWPGVNVHSLYLCGEFSIVFACLTLVSDNTCAVRPEVAVELGLVSVVPLPLNLGPAVCGRVLCCGEFGGTIPLWSLPLMWLLRCVMNVLSSDGADAWCFSEGLWRVASTGGTRFSWSTTLTSSSSRSTNADPPPSPKCIDGAKTGDWVPFLNSLNSALALLGLLTPFLTLTFDLMRDVYPSTRLLSHFGKLNLSSSSCTSPRLLICGPRTSGS